jgi:hypothetical protein
MNLSMNSFRVVSLTVVWGGGQSTPRTMALKCTVWICGLPLLLNSAAERWRNKENDTWREADLKEGKSPKETT